jgi:hypothetical protein
MTLETMYLQKILEVSKDFSRLNDRAHSLRWTILKAKDRENRQRHGRELVDIIRQQIALLERRSDLYSAYCELY